VPVKFTVTDDEVPSQIAPPPLIEAVGEGFTVTVPEAVPLHPLREYVTEYTVVEPGLTEIV
jgi:hypothetical protein